MSIMNGNTLMGHGRCMVNKLETRFEKNDPFKAKNRKIMAIPPEHNSAFGVMMPESNRRQVPMVPRGPDYTRVQRTKHLLSNGFGSRQPQQAPPLFAQNPNPYGGGLQRPPPPLFGGQPPMNRPPPMGGGGLGFGGPPPNSSFNTLTGMPGFNQPSTNLYGRPNPNPFFNKTPFGGGYGYGQDPYHRKHRHRRHRHRRRHRDDDSDWSSSVSRHRTRSPERYLGNPRYDLSDSSSSSSGSDSDSSYSSYDSRDRRRRVHHGLNGLQKKIVYDTIRAYTSANAQDVVYEDILAQMEMMEKKGFRLPRGYEKHKHDLSENEIRLYEQQLQRDKQRDQKKMSYMIKFASTGLNWFCQMMNFDWIKTSHLPGLVQEALNDGEFDDCLEGIGMYLRGSVFDNPVFSTVLKFVEKVGEAHHMAMEDEQEKLEEEQHRKDERQAQSLRQLNAFRQKQPLKVPKPPPRAPTHPPNNSAAAAAVEEVGTDDDSETGSAVSSTADLSKKK